MAPIESTIASTTANTVGTTISTLRTLLRIIAHTRSDLTGREDHLPLSRGIENWAPRRPERGWIFEQIRCRAGAVALKHPIRLDRRALDHRTALQRWRLLHKRPLLR